MTRHRASGRRLVFPVMGSVSTFVIPMAEERRVGYDAVHEALHAARLELERLEHRFSHYRRDSAITRWIAGEEVDEASVRDIEHVLRACGRLHRESDGVFRARNPHTGRLDTAGYVKGYAIGRAAEELRLHGLAAFALGVGGDAAFAGRPDPDRPWQVAVQDPARPYAVATVIPVVDAAVATSGSAQRGEHIWGRRPAAGSVASFTVIGPDIAEADAYATIGFALGEAGPAWVAGRDGYRSVVVHADGSVRADTALVSGM